MRALCRQRVGALRKSVRNMVENGGYAIRLISTEDRQ